MREIRTSGSMSGDGKRSVAAWPKLPRPSSTLPQIVHRGSETGKIVVPQRFISLPRIAPMQTECTRSVRIRACWGSKSRGRVRRRPLLGAADRAIGLGAGFAKCSGDARPQELIEHEVATLIRQLIFRIALGYEDLNDHGRWSSWCKAGRSPEELAREFEPTARSIRKPYAQIATAGLPSNQCGTMNTIHGCRTGRAIARNAKNRNIEIGGN
jgi:Transposase DDE domain group 1